MGWSRLSRACCGGKGKDWTTQIIDKEMIGPGLLPNNATNRRRLFFNIFTSQPTRDQNKTDASQHARENRGRPRLDDTQPVTWDRTYQVSIIAGNGIGGSLLVAG